MGQPMSKLLKILLSIFASVILLIIIAAIALPFFVDPNDFKPEIEAAVKKSTGRELTIDGDLELSVFPWIGVSTGKLVLSNAKGFTDKPFAEIAESNLKVKLIPLLSKEIQVSRIVLKGLVLNLAKNKQGDNNWEDLNRSDSSSKKTKQHTSKKTAKEAESSVAAPLAALAIGGISIEQAKIVWNDQQQEKYTEINDFNFITDKVVFDKPIGIDLSFSVVNKEPELTESINFSADLMINESLDVFNLNHLNIKSVTTGKEIPGEELIASLLANVSIDLSQQILAIPELTFNTGNLTLIANVSGKQIIDKPSFTGSINIAEFNLATFLKNMAITLPQMQNSSAMSRTSMQLAFNAGTDSININELLLKLDDTSIKGSANIKNFDHPAYNFAFKIDSINVDHYLPIEDASAAKSKKTIKAVSTSAQAAVAVTNLFPVETLRNFNANGQITVDKLKVNRSSMNGVIFKIKAKNGIINTEQRVKQFYQGTYSGKTSINVQGKTPRLAIDHKLIKVQVEPLIKDKFDMTNMTGTVNASVKITGRGNTEQSLKSSLNGNINFSFRDGVIKGFNLQKIIDQGKSLLGGSPLPSTQKTDQTVFSVIKGSAKITNGLLSNKDLYAEAAKLRVNGKGTANLVSEKIDYKINAKLLKKAASKTQPEKIKGLPIIINIAGSFSKPSYTLDLVAMFTEKNKEKINKKKDELLKKLDEKLGPGVSDLIKGFF